MDNWKVTNETAVFGNSPEPSANNINPNVPLSTEPAPGKKKLFLLIGAGVLLLALVFLAVFFIVLPKKTDLIVLVAPESAEVEIDGKVYKNGNYKIPVGAHTVSISAEGFSYTEYDITAKAGETFTLYDYLTEETGRYSDKDYDILELIASDDATVEKVNAYRRQLTLFDRLPLLDDNQKLYITDQRTASTCPASSLCLGLTNLSQLDEDAATESAFETLRSLSYDPNDYLILYEDAAENYYKENN